MTVQSFTPDQLKQFRKRRQNADGSGDIMLATLRSTDANVDVGFIGVPQVKNVERIVNELANRPIEKEDVLKK